MSEGNQPPAPKARGRAAALMQRLQSSASRPPTATSRPTTAEPEPSPPRPESRQEKPGAPAPAPAAAAAAPPGRERPEGGRRQRVDLPRPAKKFAGEEAGQVFPTEVNYLRVNCDLPGGGLCQHHVSFEPEVENFRLRINVMRQPEVVAAVGQTSNFDGGSILFLPIKLENARFQTSHPVTGQPVTVTVKFTNIVQLGSLMFFFNGIIKKLMDALEWVRIGRDNHYYNPKVRHELRQHALEIWPGFATSCKRAQDGGLIIEMDVSSHVLRSETVLSVFKRIQREGRGNFQDECLRQVLNEVVSTRYNNRTYKVEDIEWDKTPMSTFEQSNGNVITFLDYYRTHHGIVLEDPKQPLLVSKLKAGRWGGKGRPPAGAEAPPDRKVLLIPELCYLTGLADTQRTNFNLMRDVGEFTRLTPVQRVGAIRKFLTAIERNEECQKILDRWKLSITLELVKVDGHLFAPETIFTGGSSADNPERCDNYDLGDFSNHINRARPLEAVPISNWVIIYARQAQREAQDFIQLMMQTSRQVSVPVEVPQENVLGATRATEYIQAIRKLTGNQGGPSIVVIILSSRSDEHYQAVKKECNTFGLPSQVIISKTLGNPKKISSICRRIFLQMEAKLGGQLWGMSMPPGGLLVVGLDVYHDPGRKNASWVAIVGSINQQHTRYYSVACRQMPGEEAAHGVSIGFSKILNAYRQVNSMLPKKIIVFRDGLSASQFRMSQEFEIKQIQEAFRSMGSDYAPELCFIVCVKRIGVRIFASQQYGGGRPASRSGSRAGAEDGNYANPPPGTAVDRVIGEPNWYDFYLVSQAVRQGAVSPTHYVVIEDTSKYTATQIQRLTWKFTHLYYNWPGTVRSPAPVVYADRLAAMVGQVLQAEPHANLADKLFFL